MALPEVGVQAVVKDFNKFIGDLSKMDKANEQLGGSFGDLGVSAEAASQSFLKLAQDLSQAKTPAAAAAKAIEQLDKDLADGKINADQYSRAVAGVQEEFGLVTPGGRAAAVGVQNLTKQFRNGEITADEFAKGLKEASSGMDDTGDSAVETAAKIEILEKGFEAVRDLASQGLELAELGAQAERVEQRFAAFAEEAGGAEQILQAFQDGAGGTVSEMEAMQSATKLLQMGLVDDAQSMERVVEMATRLGDQTESASARTEGFALLLANQSIPRLDNYGISSGKVRARIEELQKETKGMSREQAFMQATMEEGSKSLLVLGDRVDDNAAKFEKAEARMADMRVELGQKLAPIFAAIMNVIAGLSGEVLVFAGALGTALPLILKFGGGIEGLGGMIAKIPAPLGVAAVAIAGVALAVSEYNNQLKKVNAEQAKTEAAIAGISNNIVAQVDAGGSLTDIMGQYGERTADAAAAVENLNTVQQIGLQVFGKADDVTRQLTSAQNEAAQAALAASTDYGEYDKAIRAYNAGVGDADLMVQALTRSQFEQIKSVQTLGGATNEAAAFVRDFSIGQDEAKTSTEELTDETRFLGSMVDDAALSSDEYTEQLDRQLDRTAMVVDETDNLSTSQANLGDEIGHNKETVRTAADILAEYAEAEEEAARKAEEMAKAEEDAAKAAEDLAAAQEDARQAAADSAIAFTDLAQSLMDATAADVAKASLDRLNEALELGVIDTDQHARASRELMLAHGLATEESLALAEGVDILGQAVIDGTLHTDDYTEAVDNLNASAEDGKVSQEELLAPFERVPAVFGEAEGAMDRVEGKLGEELPVSADKAEQALADLETKVGEAGQALLDLEGDAEAAGRATGEGFASGIFDAIPSVVLSAQEMAQAVRDQLPSSEPKDPTSPLRNLDESGMAIVSNITDGILASEGVIGEAIGDVVGGDIGDALVNVGEDIIGLGGSEVGEPIGEEIVDGIVEGIGDRWKDVSVIGVRIVDGIAEFVQLAIAQMSGLGFAQLNLGGALPSDFENLLKISGGLAGLGGAAGKLFKREEIDPLQERAKGLEQRLKDVRKVYGDIQKDMDKLNKKLLDQTLTEQERLDIEQQIGILRGQQLAPAKRLRELGNELLETNEELARKQQILTDLQTEQETAAFLKEQRDLLQMIAEHGLSASKILQGADLGADADRVAILEAMTRAMRSINQELDDQIVNRDELIAQMEEEQRLAEAQTRLAEAQQRQKFLQDQLALLALIEEKGLDADAILQGFEVGVDASLIDFTEAMRRAIEAIIAQTEEELGIASPSKVFAAIGSEMMQGLAMGIANTAGMPAAQTMAATQAAMMAPTFAMPSMAGGSTTNIDAPISISATINNGADETRFFERVTRVVSAGIAGRR